MAQQTEDMERRILSIATDRLDSIQSELSAARVSALTGDDAAQQRYTDLVKERGQLEQVIATARAALV